MKTILIFLAFISLNGLSQDSIYSLGTEKFAFDKLYLINKDIRFINSRRFILNGYDITESLQIIAMNGFIKKWDEYSQECYNDTLIADTIYYNNYLFDFGNYYVAMTLEQLEEKGYKYIGRYILSFDPFKCEYYFVNKPNFPDFIEWLKLQR